MLTLVDQLKQHVIGAFKEACERAFGEKTQQEITLGFPPNVSFGDFTIACFSLAKQFKSNPKEIATAIANAMNPTDYISSVSADGAYVNIFLSDVQSFGAVCGDISQAGPDFGKSNIGVGEKVMVEYLSPNTNKPLHLGHLRNGVLGMAVSRILESTGHTVVRANLINDRGVHICKSMLAYQRWGNGATPKSSGKKGDHFVGDLYVLYSKKSEESPDLEEEVQNMLLRWENGDQEIIDLWKLMNGWVYQGFEQTYSSCGFEFDVFYYESDTYKLGKEIVGRGLESGILEKSDDGFVYATLPVEQFSCDRDGNPTRATLLRPDGTSVYITQDIGTAILKFKEHDLTKSVYVVGSEQVHHFKALFAIIGMLGYQWARNCFHLSYGMVYLPDGKMKSREGKVVDADDLLEEVRLLAEQEILHRNSITGNNSQLLLDRSRKIALAAIKFYLLRINPAQVIHFDPSESISFEGETGPYCQYTYARCQSVLHRAEQSGLTSNNPDFSQLGNPEERNVLRMLMSFSDVVARSAQQFNPSIVCNWTIECARAINRFYQKHKVVDLDADAGLVSARLELVRLSAETLSHGLELLGIETVDEM